MSKLLVNIAIAIVGIVVIILGYSFVTRLMSDETESSGDVAVAMEEVKPNSIQINILNSTAQSGLADKARLYMRQHSFDVVEIGNHSPVQEVSQVIDRVGDIEAAKMTARAIGISDSLVSSKIDSSLFIKATIILGNDYKKLKAFD